ncbi:hypothetical protein [Nocardiopsis sp. YSL2]|uniref:hypothetical protein n=1 Tax=Nocardiopsis sp. YSL2 TaxID=2939492 RepID=UPI0026F46D52|nr:hypothetical protein [Nocardiopsis sp. YSL2]
MTTLDDRLSREQLFELRHRANEGDTLTVPGANGDLIVTATAVPGVWHIRDNDPIRVELMEMLFNWRVTIAFIRHPMLIEGGWCYFGRGWDVFQRAVQAAHAFDPAAQAAPEGFDKEALPWLGGGAFR